MNVYDVQPKCHKCEKLIAAAKEGYAALVAAADELERVSIELKKVKAERDAYKLEVNAMKINCRHLEKINGYAWKVAK
jgi:hypothetical protein